VSHVWGVAVCIKMLAIAYARGRGCVSCYILADFVAEYPCE